MDQLICTSAYRRRVLKSNTRLFHFYLQMSEEQAHIKVSCRIATRSTNTMNSTINNMTYGVDPYEIGMQQICIHMRHSNYNMHA